MKPKTSLLPFLALAGGAALFGCKGHAATPHMPGEHANVAAFSKTLAGFNIRLIAIGESVSDPQMRLADHAWTPDGFPYESAEVRLEGHFAGGSVEGGSRRSVYFELEPLQTSPSKPVTDSIDLFSYLPKNADAARSSRPITVPIYHGFNRDSAGQTILTQPASAQFDFGVNNTDPQPVMFGIAKGEYRSVAKGAASVANIGEDQTAIIASGPWGQIEATHLKRPMVVSKPPNTHSFRLLGGPFPPKGERKVLFYDANGNVVASCGDGSGGIGYAGAAFSRRPSPTEIVSYEIQERPYEFAQFDNVSFDAPQFKSCSGREGLDRAVDSPIGKVVGVTKPTQDGAWTGSILYAADGTRWIDPGSEMAGYVSGMFYPWSQRQEQSIFILFQPKDTQPSPETPASWEVFAADSPDSPGKERLAKWDSMPLRGPIDPISCKPTQRPYMRLSIRTGDGNWKTLETVPVTDQMLHTADSGSPGARVLEISFNDQGSISIWKDEKDPIPSKSTWDHARQRVRTVAHLRDGSTVETGFNTAGYSGTSPDGPWTHGIEYTRQLNGTHVQAGAKTIEFHDIVSFDIQVQNLEPVITLSIHSPID